jgi:hypothetical protein
MPSSSVAGRAGPRTVGEMGTPSFFIASFMAPMAGSLWVPKVTRVRTRRCSSAALVRSPLWAASTRPTKSSGATLAKAQMEPSAPARREGRIKPHRLDLLEHAHDVVVLGDGVIHYSRAVNEDVDRSEFFFSACY